MPATVRTDSGPVVVLAGGTGGAKLARGMLDVVGDDLTVIANTGDDIEIHGGHVSPDPDLVTYRLADRLDPRGWGLADDSFATMNGLRELGEEIWFALGDHDLAVALHRARRLTAGDRLTEAQAAITNALGLRARVLPMCDEPVRTRVLVDGRWRGLQEFLVRDHGAGRIDDVDYRHARAASPTPEVTDALARARAIVIGPSNPILSIGPILAVPGLADAIRDSPAPVVAVSPLVAGQVLKGPTAECLRWAGRSTTIDGIAGVYGDLLDGLVADEPLAGDDPSAAPSILRREVLLDTADRRREVAAATLDFARQLAAAPVTSR